MGADYADLRTGTDVAGAIRSQRVIEVLCRLMSERGVPKVLWSDNGPEFVSKALLKWAVDNNLDLALIDPGKPLAEWNGRELQRKVSG